MTEANEKTALEGIEQFLGSGQGTEAKQMPERPKPPSNAEMARLLQKEFCEYDVHMMPDILDDGIVPFAPGTLVTPRAGTYIVDEGTPYVILEAIEADDVVPQFAAEASGTMRDGFMPNIRVGRWTPFGMACIWAESWVFDEYQGEVAA